MEEALKAEQVVEPDSDMQFCTKATELDAANSVNTSVRRIIGRFLDPDVV